VIFIANINVAVCLFKNLKFSTKQECFMHEKQCGGKSMQENNW